MNNDLCVLEKAILGSPASCRCSPNAIDIRMEILGDVSDCRSFYRKKRRHAKCHHDFFTDLWVNTSICKVTNRRTQLRATSKSKKTRWAQTLISIVVFFGQSA
jgi:hypothetical protein